MKKNVILEEIEYLRNSEKFEESQKRSIDLSGQIKRMTSSIKHSPLNSPKNENKKSLAIQKINNSF